MVVLLSAQVNSENKGAEFAALVRIVAVFDEVSIQLCQPDKQCGEECLTTGWEYEREIFIQHQSGGGETESSCEDIVFPGFDTDSYYGSNGNDIAYLVADLTNILDNDHPVEDCTTMKKPRKERKNTHKSNPRGGFNMSM